MRIDCHGRRLACGRLWSDGQFSKEGFVVVHDSTTCNNFVEYIDTSTTSTLRGRRTCTIRNRLAMNSIWSLVAILDAVLESSRPDFFFFGIFITCTRLCSDQVWEVEWNFGHSISLTHSQLYFHPSQLSSELSLVCCCLWVAIWQACPLHGTFAQ